MNLLTYLLVKSTAASLSMNLLESNFLTFGFPNKSDDSKSVLVYVDDCLKFSMLSDVAKNGLL